MTEMDRKKLSASLIAPALALILASCGSQAIQNDPATKYSAETLTSEFLFAYKEFKANGGGARTSKDRPQDATKGAALPKAESSASLEGLITETRRKALGVSDMSAAEACRKVAESVAQDPSVSEADKKTIAEALGRPEP